MVSKDSPKRSYSLEQVLTDEHIGQIVQHVTDTRANNYELICSEVRPAAVGLTGFLGDHIRAVLHVKVDGKVVKVNLFVKRIPIENKPKAEFIDMNNYFKRERLMLQLLDEMKGADGPNPWCVKAYVYTDSLVVMPDLAIAGYSEHSLMETLDFRHTMVTAASLARFHAGFANYETNKILVSTGSYNFYEEHKQLLVEPTFTDTPWLRTAAKLSADFLDAVSLRYSKSSVPDLEEKLAKSYIDACASLDVMEDTLNLMLHKDLWNNNILFKYEDAVPTNAVLIDYQCVRYGPPAFDLMALLYLTTSRSFREEHETEVIKHYFKLFSDSLEDATRKRLDLIGYNEKHFFSWCEKSRMFGIFEAVAIFPQVLMDAKTAERVFDDPETFASIVGQDRSGPVVEYAKQCPVYRQRQLEVSEEYVERFVAGKP